MYNPYRPGYQEGGTSTATGERYNPFAWAAAIQTDLRERFGGVRHGSRASYALVEGTNKRAIVKINDVGPLTLGRVIDFNEQTMRYFDPTLRRGVIQNVRVTPLSGDNWTPGPITEVPYDSTLGDRCGTPEAGATSNNHLSGTGGLVRAFSPHLQIWLNWSGGGL